MKMKKNINVPNIKTNNTLLNNKKNTLLEKLTIHFSNKLKELMLQFDYPLSKLKTDISSFIGGLENENLKKYDFIIGRIGTLLLEKITNRKQNYKAAIDPNNELNHNNINTQQNNKSSKPVMTLDDLYRYKLKENHNSENPNIIYSSYSNNQHEFNIEDNEYEINYNNSNNNCQSEAAAAATKEKKIYQLYTKNPIAKQQNTANHLLPWVMNEKNEKLISLKEKANDEWALIAKFNHLKLLEDQKEGKNLKEEKQKKFKELLHSQLLEKDMLKKQKQEEDETSKERYL